MSLHFTCLFVIKIILIFCVIVDSQFRNCSKKEICIPVRNCKVIVNAIMAIKEPLLLSEKQKFQQFQCGMDNNKEPLVCCTDNNDMDDDINQLQSYTNPAFNVSGHIKYFADFTNHVNLHLLPRNTCGPIYSNKSTSKAWNDTNADLLEYPWLVILLHKTSDGLTFNCGGSLINDRYVLTAAHCVSNIDSTKNPFAVRLGEYDFSTNIDCEPSDKFIKCADSVQDILISKIIIHSDYNKRKYLNDIALIRLAEPANLSPENVRPICLPFLPSFQLLRLTRFTVSGWGIIYEKRSTKVARARIQYIPQVECQEILGNVVQITDAHICAGGEEGVDTCRGDPGSPLIYSGYNRETQYVQYGIVSIGGDSCSPSNTIPAIYTNVFYYMNWILDHMEA